ncbi:unnamed protein product [Strongylus vulgaris]|uniref:Uncharacterized protein n=1 Tax=Strongylus vulgaris TaxID=40348 RepID=A0A3P7IVT5_STRVU|nr:unnamed protein product [Strongylus vulgaris]
MKKNEISHQFEIKNNIYRFCFYQKSRTFAREFFFPLQVINHVVVPAAVSAKRTPVQGRPVVQPRRLQPSRRASVPARLPALGADANHQSNFFPRPNLIIIRDGRIVELTDQQQKDLNLILSAMAVPKNEPSNRRRAPIRRGRAPIRRMRPRVQFQRVHV